MQVLELEQLILKKMSNKIEISRYDIKVSQVMTWTFTLLFLIVSTGIMFSSFTLNGLYVVILILFIIIMINKASAKMWNIWYENGFLHIQNIYTTRKVSVNQFKKIEMTSVFNNSYTLYLYDDTKYQFRIKQTDDLVLFFKTDPQFYAKKITQILNDVKQNPAL
ncbi:hypothetical protein [Arcicella rigui]|uniref:YcxB-like protein domain-containing protein n=1 Tax=Arcicella rigui TaxID=797020 RepID=A0ABU5Q5Q4_9BACT|nr:hypothetical protein [Arcicella rigui]MEA5137937.1 hypothetical protein [Arcicella rigui]